MIYINPNFFKESLLEKNKNGDICTKRGAPWIFVIFAGVICDFISLYLFFNIKNFSDPDSVKIKLYVVCILIFLSGFIILWISFSEKNILTKKNIILQRSFFCLKTPIEILRQDIIINPPKMLNNKIIFYIRQKKIIINLTLNCAGSFGFVNEIFKRTKTPYPIELLSKYLYNQNCTFAKYFKVENSYLQSELDVTAKKKH